MFIGIVSFIHEIKQPSNKKWRQKVSLTLGTKKLWKFSGTNVVLSALKRGSKEGS